MGIDRQIDRYPRTKIETDVGTLVFSMSNNAQEGKKKVPTFLGVPRGRGPPSVKAETIIIKSKNKSNNTAAE